MGNYVSNIEDLVIYVLKNGDSIFAKAKNGDPKSLFQMGLIHLVGINTSISFKNASLCFGNQALNNDLEAIRLLGFIAECEGNYSLAFQNYAKTINGEDLTYLDKISMGRYELQNYLQYLNLPLTLNHEITSIFNTYSNDHSSRIGTSIKIAELCNDEMTCMEVAKNLFYANDYISAIQWLKKGNIKADNPLYVKIVKLSEKSKETLMRSKDIQIVDLKNNSLLSLKGKTSFMNVAKKACDAAAATSMNEWIMQNQNRIDGVISAYKEREYMEYLREEEEKRRKRNKILNTIIIILAILLFILLCMVANNTQ